jgi:hypothetical protein
MEDQLKNTFILLDAEEKYLMSNKEATPEGVL